MTQERNTPMWTPDPSRMSATELSQFTAYASKATGLRLESYDTLHEWSTTNISEFWSLLWDYFQVKGVKGNQILLNGDKMPGACWFPEAKLNFAENLLQHGASEIALIERGEHGRRISLSYQELNQQVSQLASFLSSHGIKKGDVVAAFLPNSRYAVIGMLATASLGAIWTSCSPDFGINGVLDRFEQTSPKLLIAADGYYYGGKAISSLERVEAIRKKLKTLSATIIAPYLNSSENIETRSQDEGIYTWDRSLSAHSPAPIKFEAVNFDSPLYILYSSGTTGKPKCIVHSVGGTLLQHLKELALHTNVKTGTKLFYYTTCGWMMWNWLVSGLALGATLIIYDGSPFHPDQSVLFDIASEEGINVFGASAKYYAACEKYALTPGATHDLTSLESILSTGSPLSHESFDYIYREIKNDVCVSSISGGTDIISCFALGNPNLPVYKGELQCIGLGMDVAFYDESGTELQSGKGELVCKQAFPSMPTGFWNDVDNKKYSAAYFQRYQNTWAHGDYGELIRHHDVEAVPQTGAIIHGRSDAVLNPGGVRIGTAEIYRQVEKVNEVFESIAIGQQWKDDVRIILFVRLQEGQKLDEELESKIRTSIRQNTSPRHVPNKILQVADIPRTLSGKIVELAVRKVIHGEEVNNTEALANPEALELFKNLDVLKHD